MTLANCRQCGRLFNQVARDICPQCIAEEEEQFMKVRDYLRDNRYASMAEVSEATEVPVTLIIRFIQEGRLKVVQNPNITYPCERCGKAIAHGRYCQECATEMKKSLDQLMEKIQPPAEEKKTGKYYYYRKEAER